jgi:hypothetical protein
VALSNKILFDTTLLQWWTSFFSSVGGAPLLVELKLFLKNMVKQLLLIVKIVK